MHYWFDEKTTEGCVIDLEPDYQRVHVWTPEQQSTFVEFTLRGGTSGKNIYFNCTSWMQNFNTPIEVVDGKQRLTAALRFMAGEVPAFGHCIGEYEDNPGLFDASFRFHVNDLKTKAEVIQWYLDLNYRGTPHTDDELQRVQRLLEESK